MSSKRFAIDAADGDGDEIWKILTALFGATALGQAIDSAKKTADLNELHGLSSTRGA